MSQYQSFVFQDYQFDPILKTLQLIYSYDTAQTFTETYHFDFDFVQYDPAALDMALQILFFLAGISYYKAFLAPQIVVKKGTIDSSLAIFLNKTYQRGLGEFFYVNRLNPHTKIVFPETGGFKVASSSAGRGLLVGLGGGKDSLVTVEALRQTASVATWSVGHREQLSPLVEKIGLPHFWVERKWDLKLLDLNSQGALNGHVPISAILAATGTVVALLTGYQDVVVSNEHSANEPTLSYDGVLINHQYSKSQEFETDFQGLLTQQFGESLRYYSFLRPLSELRIAELFVKSSLQKYATIFSSCNRAYTLDSHHMSWCGHCPKCAFIYLALVNFCEKTDLDLIFGNRDLLRDSSLETIYRNLLGIAGDKPLECVGEIEESRQAMRWLQSQNKEFEKYRFELASGYNYKNLYSHSMPLDVYDRLLANLNQWV